MWSAEWYGNQKIIPFNILYNKNNKKNSNKKKFKVIYDRKINKSYIHFTIIRGKDIIILKKRNKKEVSESTALKQKRP